MTGRTTYCLAGFFLWWWWYRWGSLSELTDGQALVLESASVLARVILGSAQEEIGLTRLQRQVQDQVAAMAAQVRETDYHRPHAWGSSSSHPAPVRG